MTEVSKIWQEYYISSGAKNAMYTLRCARGGSTIGMVRDFYICNLSTDLDKAAEKAQDYYDRVVGRYNYQDTDLIVSHLNLEPDCELNVRSGRLSVEDTNRIMLIEQGLFPFGKYYGQKIEDAPDSYILFFADKVDDEKIVTQTLAMVCMGIALERDLIKKREEAKAARLEQDLKSNFVGEEKQRMEFEGEVISCFYKQNDYSESYHINKIRVGEDIIVHFGKKLGEKGETIRFKATVKKNTEYNGIKSTIVNRPKIME